MNIHHFSGFLRRFYASGPQKRPVRLPLFSACVFFILLTLAGAGLLPDTEPITLQAEPLPFTPKEFFIAGINDERSDKKAVAWLIPLTKSAGSSAKTVPVDLKGGALNAIKLFVKNSLPLNAALRPVLINLRECSITEKPLEDGSVEGMVVVSMEFNLQGKNENKYLTEYQGSTRYVRAPGRHTIVEQALRQSLAGSLKYLNNWMDQEAPHNIKLAKGMKISFTDFTESTGDDTVYYDPARPVTWDDFLAKPAKKDKFVASIFPNFGYRNSSEVKDGYLNLDITFRVYMLKNISWVRDNARDAYGLNHEQRHFDITKIVVERFKQKILQKELSMEDFDGELGFLYIEAYREMNKLQDQYDHETSHGINRAAQEQWNKKISAELESFGILTP